MNVPLARITTNQELMDIMFDQVSDTHPHRAATPTTSAVTSTTSTTFTHHSTSATRATW